MKFQEKFDTLFSYREQLDETEKELFDVLMEYGKEVAFAIESAV
ncbi:MAG: hypothetical protein ABH842_05780 [Candidatus Micrarchaeota archaeon]